MVDLAWECPLPVFILAAARTPLGAFGGSLRNMEASELGAHALRATLHRGRAEDTRLGQVIMGSAFPLGGNPARVAALAADVPVAVPAFTPCLGSGSGLKAVMLGAQSLQAGRPGLVLAGGADNLSRVPYLAPGARWGVRIGEADLLDGLLLEQPLLKSETEALVRAHGISLEAQNAWSAESRRRAQECQAARSPEIAPLEVPGRKGSRLLSEDESPGSSRVPQIPNYPAPADGAAALLLSSEIGPSVGAPLGRILGWAESGLGWAAAIRELLLQTGLTLGSIDRWELQERSAAHVLALQAELDLEPERVNVQGGALGLGDASGASGARLLMSLLHTLQAEGLRTGIVAIQAGHGLGLAMAVTRI